MCCAERMTNLPSKSRAFGLRLLRRIALALVGGSLGLAAYVAFGVAGTPDSIQVKTSALLPTSNAHVMYYVSDLRALGWSRWAYLWVGGFSNEETHTAGGELQTWDFHADNGVSFRMTPMASNDTSAVYQLAMLEPDSWVGRIVFEVDESDGGTSLQVTADEGGLSWLQRFAVWALGTSPDVVVDHQFALDVLRDWTAADLKNGSVRHIDGLEPVHFARSGL